MKIEQAGFVRYAPGDPGNIALTPIDGLSVIGLGSQPIRLRGGFGNVVHLVARPEEGPRHTLGFERVLPEGDRRTFTVDVTFHEGADGLLHHVELYPLDHTAVVESGIIAARLSVDGTPFGAWNQLGIARARPEAPGFNQTTTVAPLPRLLSIPHLYKYMPSRFVQGFVDRGRLRIGSLGYFRRFEPNNRLRTDQTEARGWFAYRQTTPIRIADLPEYLKPYLNALPPGALDGSTSFEFELVHPDRPAFCMSSEISSSAAGDYDACVRISRPLEFCKRLTSAFERYLERDFDGSLGRVMYGSKDLPATHADFMPLPFLKTVDYEQEQEIRVVWQIAARTDPGYYDIEAPEICDLVEEIDIPSTPE